VNKVIKTTDPRTGEAVDNEHGFEHEGTWITDRTKSPCGRFELTPEESEKLYGKENG